MSPVVTRGLVREEHLARLHVCCEVLDPEPLASFDEPRAEALLARAEVLLTGWGCPPLDAAALERSPRLRAVVHAAGSVKPWVTAAVWDRKLLVSSAATANAVPVAEYSLAAILLANKGAFALSRRYARERKGRLWGREHPELGNLGKRVGVVGASRIGRRVIELLRPFELEVRVADPTLADEAARALGVESAELDALLCWADVVSLHAPLLPETRGLIDGRRLALMKNGAVLINTARGGLVDGKALEDELVSGRISAVLDTTEPEVLASDSPLYELENVFLTPHIAGAMGTETSRLIDLAISEIARFARGDGLEHAITREDLGRIA